MILIISILISNLFSQGFDWELDSRMPYQVPDKFIGANVSYSFLDLGTNVDLIENGVFCCNYEQFEGKNLILGIVYEKWIQNKFSYFISLNYSKMDLSSNTNISYPVNQSDSAIFKNELDISYNNLLFEIGSKYKFFDNFNAGLTLDFNFVLNKSESVKSTILAPDYLTFNGNKSRNLEDVNINNSNDLFFNCNLFVSYDYNFKIPIYLSPFFKINIFNSNIFNNISDNQLNYQIGIRVFKNL